MKIEILTDVELLEINGGDWFDIGIAALAACALAAAFI
jgi:hypothetical protein